MLSVAHAVGALMVLLVACATLLTDSYVLMPESEEDFAPPEKHRNAFTVAQRCRSDDKKCEEASPRKFRINISVKSDSVAYTAGISYRGDFDGAVDTGMALMIPEKAKWSVDKNCRGVESKTGPEVGWRYGDRAQWVDARQILVSSIAACGSDAAIEWTLPRVDLIVGVSERATYVRVVHPVFAGWADEWKTKEVSAVDMFVYLEDDKFSRNDNTYPAFDEDLNPTSAMWDSFNIDDWSFRSLTFGYSNKILRTVEDLNQSVIFLAAGILIGSVRWANVYSRRPRSSVV